VNAEEIRKRLSIILKKVAPSTPDKSSETELSLSVMPEENTMDSVAALQLVLAIEEEFGITVEDQDIGPNNFGDLSSLCGFVAGKLARS
jgi:acyl carrier protein